jgi:hypothetical protein
MGRSDAAPRRDGNYLRRNDLLALPAERKSRSGALSGDPAAPPRLEPSAKKTHSPTTLHGAGFHGGDSMPDILTDLLKPVPSIAPSDIPALSDDECLIRLAQAVRDQASEHLDEVARLIGRLAVTIE